MNTFTKNTGIVSSSIAILSIIVWFVSFILIAGEGELFYWSGIDHYFDYITGKDLFFENLAKTFMMIFSLAFLILHFSLLEKEILKGGLAAKLGLLFMTFYGLLSSIHYFTQISMVRLSIMQDQTSHLEAFLQANPISYSSSINMLGWTLMLGLASFFMYFHFRSIEGNKWLRIFHMINFIFCLGAFFGFLIQYDPLTFISINIGVGGSITAISIIALNQFIKAKKLS